MKRFLIIFVLFKFFMANQMMFAQDFTVNIESTDGCGGYIKPLKAGGSIQFQIKVKNNTRDTLNMSIDIASMGTVSSWVSSDPTSITVLPTQTV